MTPFYYGLETERLKTGLMKFTVEDLKSKDLYPLPDLILFDTLARPWATRRAQTSKEDRFFKAVVRYGKPFRYRFLR